MPRALVVAGLVLASTVAGSASEFRYDGPALVVDYAGPVLVDNSQVLFTNEDARAMTVAALVAERAPTLQALAPAISGWAAMQGIHPRILVTLLERYWHGVEPSFTPANVEVVYQVTAGLAAVFWDEYDSPLAATRAVLAVATAYRLPTDLPAELARPRQLPTTPPRVSPFGFFQPPWTIGDTWAGGGAHGDTGSGARNALDYWAASGGWGSNTSSYWVAAMQAGTATVHAACSITVDHADGWRTTYYHLENPQFAIGGSYPVTRNTALANYANDEATALCLGGSSTGPHVHSGLYLNGVRVEVDQANVDFTAYSHHAGVGQYDFNCATSWYDHFALGTVCPAYDQLLNDAPLVDGLVFSSGFEGGSTADWSSAQP